MSHCPCLYVLGSTHSRTRFERIVYPLSYIWTVSDIWNIGSMMHIYKQGSSNGTIHLQCDVIESLLGLIKSYIWQKLVAEINMSGSSELMRGAPRGVLWISSEGQENSNQGYSGRCYCSVHRLLKATNDDYIPCVTPQSVVSFKVIYSANGKKIGHVAVEIQIQFKFNCFEPLIPMPLSNYKVIRWFQLPITVSRLIIIRFFGHWNGPRGPSQYKDDVLPV